MGKLSDGWIRLSTGWVALAALIVFVAFTALVLPGQASEASAASAGAGAPDTSLFYTPADLYRMAEAYGPEGRQAYIRARFTFDVIWPIVYTVFLGTAASWLLRQAWPVPSRWYRLNLVPVIGALLDYLENSATSLVMARYPLQTPVVDLLAPLFTLTKWLFVGGSFVLLLVLAGVALVRRLRR